MGEITNNQQEFFRIIPFGYELTYRFFYNIFNTWERYQELLTYFFSGFGSGTTKILFYFFVIDGSGTTLISFHFTLLVQEFNSLAISKR